MLVSDRADQRNEEKKCKETSCDHLIYYTKKNYSTFFVLQNCVIFDIQLLLNTLNEATIRIVVPIQAYYKMPPEKVTIFYLCCNIHNGKKLY